MRIAEPPSATVAAAAAGDLEAIDTVLGAIQPGIYNLAIRMLGNRDDAADSTQEILLRVVTRLAGFRGQAAFSTWVFTVAKTQLLNASIRLRESPEISLEGMGQHLAKGLAYADSLNVSGSGERVLTPEDKLEARQIAIRCTQGMLLALDRPQRLAYLLDTIFGLSSDDAAYVLEITPAAFRQRLGRARRALDGFTGTSCGLVNPSAACRCERQLPAERRRISNADSQLRRLALETGQERRHAERQLDGIVRMSESAAIFRAHPNYQAPDAMLGAIRAVLLREVQASPKPGPIVQ